MIMINLWESMIREFKVMFTCGPVMQAIIWPKTYRVYPEINGTSMLINDKVYCSWSVDIVNSSFPFDLIDQPKYYISNRGYQVYYDLSQTVPIAPANYSHLPKDVEPFVDGFKYKAVGSQKYLLIARVGNDCFLFGGNQEKGLGLENN